MKIKQLHLAEILIMALVVMCLSLIAPKKVSAGAFSVTGPSSTTESTSGGEHHFEAYDGPIVTVGNPVEITISADTAVSDTTHSSILISYTANGDCGFLGGKGIPYIAKSGFSTSLGLHTTSAPHTTSVDVYPVYNPNYTGTRSCTVSFSHNAAERLNDEVVSNYSGVAISSKTISILDAQSAPPASDPTPPPEPESDPVEEPKKPDIPVAKLVDNKGNEIKLPKGEDRFNYTSSDPIIISGTTVPKGVVKLYIFSEPQEATVIADESGAWTYRITAIEPGDHHVEAEVTDPSTGETSDREKVLAFTVDASSSESEEAEPIGMSGEDLDSSDSSLNSALVMAAMFALATLLGVGIYVWYRKQNHAHVKTVNVEDSKAEVEPTESDQSTPQSPDA